MLAAHLLFWFSGGAMGIIGLIGGVVVIVKEARQMDDSATQSSGASEPESALLT